LRAQAPGERIEKTAQGLNARPDEEMMRQNRRYPKSGKHSPLRGVRANPKGKFPAILETESGVKVRSKYERTCADYLYRENVRFEYEPLMLVGGKQVRPDFYLPDYNLFLEICGYDHMPYYRSRIARKQRLFKGLGLKAVFIHYDGKGSLEEMIRAELESLSEL